MNEIRKTKHASLRAVPLSGRGNLCINDQLKNSCRSNEELNERCLDLQKKGTSSQHASSRRCVIGDRTGAQRCEFLPPSDEPEKLDEFRDNVFASVHTVEDMEDLGRANKVCPYYGSRRAIKQAQVNFLRGSRERKLIERSWSRCRIRWFCQSKLESRLVLICMGQSLALIRNRAHDTQTSGRH